MRAQGICACRQTGAGGGRRPGRRTAPLDRRGPRSCPGAAQGHPGQGARAALCRGARSHCADALPGLTAAHRGPCARTYAATRGRGRATAACAVRRPIRHGRASQSPAEPPTFAHIFRYGHIHEMARAHRGARVAARGADRVAAPRPRPGPGRVCSGTACAHPKRCEYQCRAARESVPRGARAGSAPGRCAVYVRAPDIAGQAQGAQARDAGSPTCDARCCLPLQRTPRDPGARVQGGRAQESCRQGGHDPVPWPLPRFRTAVAAGHSCRGAYSRACHVGRHWRRS